jgi:hypothetical protein
MSNNQLFFALAGLMLGLAGGGKLYLDAKIGQIDAKIDPIRTQVDRLIDYMVAHEGRISRLEERTAKRTQ